ncbi:MAG: nuclear transport factor 2 family protein [Acidobacteria bacterium]|nr:nuclear transport factor 2 family protein [Acidobacteriota bacterium]
MVKNCLECLPEPQSPQRTLKRAERAFSRASETKGMREAFLAYLADDAIIFRPHPVEGKKWYLERPASPGVLTWQPTAAEVSRSGDLGCTYGTSEFKGNGNESAESSSYVRIWRKRVGGQWKVVLDIAHPIPPPKSGQ